MRIEGSCHCGAVRFSCEAYAPVPYQRCYCSICRKTAGGGGYAINLGARAESLEVAGREHTSSYHARIEEDGEVRVSGAERVFCRHCASCLWLFDPAWPELVHPFASAVDTALPEAPERAHVSLESKAPWVPLREGPEEHHYPRFSRESLEQWHVRLGLYGGSPEKRR